MPVEKSIPRCTCCLFIAAVTCHALVLIGNIATANMLHGLGDSASGWSKVGKQLSYSMDHELNPAMQSVTQSLISTIDAVTELENGLDIVLSLAGGTSDTVCKQFNTSIDETAFKASALKNMEKVVNKSMAKVNQSLNKFMDAVSPALTQLSDWLAGFGDKIQDSMEEFGTTVDRAQKIFDQVTSKISLQAASPEDEKKMLDQTFEIFDTDSGGTIDIVNMHQIAGLYGITALEGKKAESLMDKYNTDTKSGREIDRNEYEGFVKDASLPNLMVSILRSYTKKLSIIGGNVGLASMRAELAASMVDYVSLVSAKNLTKIEVLTGKLVNADSQVPMAFLADMWYQFTENLHSPDNIALIDVGQLFANDSVKLGPARTLQAIDKLSNCTFYAAEGFRVEDQDDVVKQVVTWVSNAPGGDAVLQNGTVENSAGNWAESYYNWVHEKSEKYMKTHTAASGNKAMGSVASKHARELQEALLGGKSAAANGQDPDAERVSGSGQPARPETLAFAKEFSEEILENAHEKNKLASDFSGTSSDALDSIANAMSGMIKKTQNFLTTMEKFAGPQGQENIKKEASNFIAGTSQDILTISNSQIERAVDNVKCTAGDQAACDKGGKKLDLPMQMSGAVVFLSSTASDLKSALPTVIDNLKFAKKEVSSVSSAINSIMQMLGLKAPPIFRQVASLYKTAWIAYFTFFFLFTATMLFYAFWASGWFGGPQANVHSPDYEPPRTFGQRLRTCCNSCLACINGCCSGHLCFWSCLLLAQVVVLLLFLTSLVICLLTGVQAFLGAGCSQIYLIGDDDVCSAALDLVKMFLKTFAIADVPQLNDVCSKEKLLTCALIREEVEASAMKVILGALLASVLSFQMLLDSATKHERARCNRLLDEEEKKGAAASSSQ